MINKVLVLGGGSAGFIAAITLKAKFPTLPVTVVRSQEIGIIGVGEGTTTNLPDHLFNFCRIPRADFFANAEPLWKLGPRFVNWGPRAHFDFTFTPQLDTQISGFSRATGFYYDAFPEGEMGIDSALMTKNKVFLRRPDNGLPAVDPSSLAMHIENEKFVAFLETHARKIGVQILDDTVREVRQDDHGVSALVMSSGESLAADLYLDCSGFFSLLTGKTLDEPFIPFNSTLFCDRAVVGGWQRTIEPIQPYTTCETMNAGWCWQIELEHRVNRGYVFSSNFISDDEAEREFRAKCPKATHARVVKFITGRRRSVWVKNVVAIGNAAGFVEPLEATALAAVCMAMNWLANSLLDTERQVRPSQVAMFNTACTEAWDGIRRFLSVHYKFNTRLSTPFWNACRNDTDLAGAEHIVEYYQANGPSTLWKPLLVSRVDVFQYEGYLSLLAGQRVPHRAAFKPTPEESTRWQHFQRYLADLTTRAYTIPEALRLTRSPQWSWAPPPQV
jgi:tryptophan halogenase